MTAPHLVKGQRRSVIFSCLHLLCLIVFQTTFIVLVFFDMGEFEGKVSNLQTATLALLLICGSFVFCIYLLFFILFLIGLKLHFLILVANFAFWMCLSLVVWIAATVFGFYELSAVLIVLGGIIIINNSLLIFNLYFAVREMYNKQYYFKRGINCCC